MDVEQEGLNVTFIRVIKKINSGCDDWGWTTCIGINHWLLPEVGLFYFCFIRGPRSLLMFAFNIVFLHLFWSRNSNF